MRIAHAPFRLLGIALLWACVPTVVLAQNGPEQIFYGGTILTMSTESPVAEALAVSGDSIVAVGSNEEILGLSTSATHLIRLNGRTVIPGFVDAHTHIFSEASKRGMTLTQVHGIALQYGVTALGEINAMPELIDEMRSFNEMDQLRIRTSLYMPVTDACGVDLGDWYRDYPPTRSRRERLRIGGVKIYADGGTCGGPATTFEYDGQMGDLWRSQAAMNALVSEVHDLGYQAAIHALGDRGIEQALNAIEHVTGGGENTLRHRIEHNSFVRRDLLGRHGETGATAVLFGMYPTCAEVNFGAITGRFGKDNVRWHDDWRALLDNNENLKAGWHSDYPFLVLDPMAHLYSYVTRKQIDANAKICNPPSWLAEHAITVEEALALMTRGAAFALDWDDAIGSIEVGKLADFVVLSENPAVGSPDRIPKIQVLATYIGGGLMFCRDTESSVCGLPTGTNDEIPVSSGIELFPGFPNPASGSTTITFRLEHSMSVELAVYDVTGRRVATLVDGVEHAGIYQRTWTNKSGAGGVFVLVLQTEAGRSVQTLVTAPR